MKQSYYYLTASLPVLAFGAKAPFSYSDFLSLCEEQLQGCDMDIIRRAAISAPEDTEDSFHLLAEWKSFDTALRNEIARTRAGRKTKDAARYIKGEGYPNPFVAGLAEWAVNQENPLEAELGLDRARWERIEGLGRWHYFDIEYLVSYALKLQIVKRWELINSQGGMQVLRDLLIA